MTAAAVRVLQEDPDGFWLMVEPGDVDWANHDDNIDNSIGAIFSGDDAVKTITDWIDARNAWSESLLIVTADHGHYFHLVNPAALVSDPEATRNTAARASLGNQP
jgi:alkaline phosphatase